MSEAVAKIDQQLQHVRRVEAGYRKVIRRAHEAMRMDTVNPEKARRKYEKTKAKYEHKIEKLQPKVRQLTARREELKGEHPAKG
ncbi:MAG TPA: hypothetical protein VIB49_07040 [Thermoplasmata archaeon]|jgi:uncharacterized damage-inducible protein DinB